MKIPSQQQSLLDVPARVLMRPIEPVISMMRVEVFVPAEQMGLPPDLQEAFDYRFVDLDAQCETVSAYGLDLSRALTDREESALSDAWFHHGVWSRVLTR